MFRGELKEARAVKIEKSQGLTAAYYQGKVAWDKGKWAKANPYQKGSPEHTMWRAGYHGALQEYCSHIQIDSGGATEK